MSVTLTTRERTAGQLAVTIQNSFNKAVLLPLGIIAGYEAYASRLRVIVTTGGEEHTAIFTGGPPAIAGRLDPLVIPLLPEACYTVRTPVAQFYVPDGSESLEELLLLQGLLRVELDVQNADCPPYGYPNPNMIECWQGRLVSNTIELPLG